MLKKYATVFMFLIFSCQCLTSYGQVEDIKKKARKENRVSNENYRSNRSQSSSSNNDNDDNNSFLGGVIADLFFSMLWGTIDLAQSATLAQKPVYAHVSSIEGKMWVGYAHNKSGLLLSPELEGNWGIISTDFRYVNLQDRTGTLENFDWQVIKFNLPIKSFKGSFGLGFTQLQDPGTTFFEYTAGIELHLFENNLVLSTEYRSTGEGQDEKFRQEMNFQVDYRTVSMGRFHISPMIGFRYQNYYASNEFWFFNGGVAIRLY